MTPNDKHFISPKALIQTFQTPKEKNMQSSRLPATNRFQMKKCGSNKYTKWHTKCQTNVIQFVLLFIVSLENGYVSELIAGVF